MGAFLGGPCSGLATVRPIEAGAEENEHNKRRRVQTRQHGITSAGGKGHRNLEISAGDGGNGLKNEGAWTSGLVIQKLAFPSDSTLGSRLEMLQHACGDGVGAKERTVTK